ncbi:MAG: class I SAM-dependent methyltransferase [Candidatus Woesearchaeota archaeon]
MSNPKYYKSGFDTSAVKGYDLFVNIASFFQMKKYRREAIELLEIKEGQSAIDFACGTGEFTIILAEKVGVTGKVTGIDLSSKMLEIAISKSKNYPQISYLRQNFEDAPNGTFNVAVIGLAAHEVPREVRMKLYQSAFASLKKGGMLLIMDYAPYNKGIFGLPYRFYLKTVESPYGFEYAGEDHEKDLKQAGFSLINMKTFHRVLDVCIYRKM